jgi:hypothetical protein
LNEFLFDLSDSFQFVSDLLLFLDWWFFWSYLWFIHWLIFFVFFVLKKWRKELLLQFWIHIFSIQKEYVFYERMKMECCCIILMFVMNTSE